MTAREKLPAARPMVLNDALAKGISEAVRRGMPITKAAHLAGVSTAAVMQWCRRGREAEIILAEGGEITPNEERCVNFLQMVESARAEAQQAHLANIVQAAGNGAWQASAWFLERTDPENWARRDRLAITGDDGGPVRVEISAKESLRDKMQAMQQRAMDVIEATARDDDPPALRVAQ